MPKRVGIAGYRGYSGAELVKILESHEQFEPVLLEHRSDAADRPIPIGADLRERIACTAEAAAAAGLEAALLATPPDVSMELAPAMLAAGLKVVDLSGAFRLRTVTNYKRWYKEEHTAPDLLASAVYGLTEFYSDKVRTARFVANPGCYPTAANLAIQPLIAADLIDRAGGIVCDAKSGVSGAGRKPSLKTHFCEVTENFSAYSMLDHRHVPEVLMNAGLEEGEFSFVAQLIPIHRGILETIYFRAKTDSSAELIETYLKRYAGWASVRVYDSGVIPDIASVARTNYCDLGVRLDPATRRAVVLSVIDNLGKGAAGQAIQNLNLMFGLDHFEGLAA